MQIDNPTRDALIPFVHDQQPLGPADASKVSDPTAAAMLYDWSNRSFAELLKGSHVVVGRRGAGKSALVNTYEIRAELIRLARENSGADAFDYLRKLGVSEDAVRRIPDVIERINTPEEMLRLRAAIGDQAPPAVEILAKYWKLRILLLANDAMRKHFEKTGRDNVVYGASQFWKKAKRTPRNFARHFLSLDDVGDDESEIPHFSTLRQDEATLDTLVKELMTITSASRLRVVVIIDSMETYDHEGAGLAMMGGLLKAAGELIAQRFSHFQISVCIPAERYQEFAEAASNADKDFYQIQFLHWNTHELMHVAAYRLMLYFRLHQEKEYNEIAKIDISSPSGLKLFWLRYFPPTITNLLGQQEDVFRYILRHTLLLPRHLLLILNSIGAQNSRATSRPPFGGSVISEDIIRKGVQTSEHTIKTSIVQMYRQFIPRVGSILTNSLPELLAVDEDDPTPRVISYGRLYKVWRSTAQASMAAAKFDEFKDYCELLLSMGVLGIVEATDQINETYIEGRFEFSEAKASSINSKTKLCVHPIFSSQYGQERNSTSDKRVVLPRAIEV